MTVKIAAAILGFIITICTPAVGQSDNRIVSGQRVGPVRLGMTPSELYRAMGDPMDMRNDRNSTLYAFPGVGVYVINGRVAQIDVISDKYSTAEGVRVGDSELAIQAKLGSPQKRDYRPNTHNYVYWYNRRSIGFTINKDGKVIGINIYPPD